MRLSSHRSLRPLMLDDVELNPGLMQDDSSLQASAFVQLFSNYSCCFLDNFWLGIPPRLWCLGNNVIVSPFYRIYCRTPFTPLTTTMYLSSICDEPTLDCILNTVWKLQASFSTLRESNNHSTVCYHYDLGELLWMCKMRKNSVDKWSVWAFCIGICVVKHLAVTNASIVT